MDINAALLTQYMLIDLIVFYIGLLIVRFAPVKLRTFQGVYLLLGATSLGLHYYLLDNPNLFGILISLASGIVATILFAGFGGTKVAPIDYQTVLVGVGLFPWYLGIKISMIYVASALVISLLWTIANILIAFRSVKINPMPIKRAKLVLSAENFEKFKKKASPVLTHPLGISAFIAVLSMTLVFS